MLYTGVHALDRLLWLVDSPVQRVQAAIRQFSATSRVEEAIAALLEFKNQAVATLAVNGPTYPCGPTGWRSEIYGTEGVVRIQARQSVAVSGSRLTQQVDVRKAAAEKGENYNFRRQARAFVNAIREDGDSPISGRTGLKVLEVCEVVYGRA